MAEAVFRAPIPYAPQSCAVKRLREKEEKEDNNEKILLSRCRAGEKMAFNILLNRHRKRVMNLAFQWLGDVNTAEDVTQDVFVTAFASIAQFRGDAAFSTWLYRLTLNACRERQRHHKPLMPLPPDWKSSAVAHELSPEMNAVYRSAVQYALCRLSPVLREVVILREMQELSYEEIASVLGVSIGTVRSRLHEGRHKFRVIWEAL